MGSGGERSPLADEEVRNRLIDELLADLATPQSYQFIVDSLYDYFQNSDPNADFSVYYEKYFAMWKREIYTDYQKARNLHVDEDSEEKRIRYYIPPAAVHRVVTGFERSNKYVRFHTVATAVRPQDVLKMSSLKDNHGNEISTKVYKK